MISPLSILVVFKEALNNAPRPLRFLSYCHKHKHKISIACASPLGDDLEFSYSFTEISKVETGKYQRIVLKLLRMLIPFSFIKEKINQLLYDLDGLRELVDLNEYNLIYVADLHMLPLLTKYKKGAKLIFDAREYYPLQYEDNLNFMLFEKGECVRILRENLASCNQVITVSPGLAEAYHKNFNVLPEVVLSLPNYQAEQISNRGDETIKILYHGMANRNRRIENFIKIIDLLTIDATLNLYLLGEISYINELKELAGNNSKIFFHDPVAFHDIINTVNQYDIGICYYEPTSFNIRHCLPNKFFEYIQARLVIAIGPSPDMAEMLAKYECGIVSKDFSIESMVEELNSLTRSRVNDLKEKSDIAAKFFCFENEEVKFSNIISSLTKSIYP
jgi:hypothetical protein